MAKFICILCKNSILWLQNTNVMATKKKTGNENVVTTRLDPAVKKKIEAMAKREERAVSYIVKRLLTKAVA